MNIQTVSVVTSQDKWPVLFSIPSSLGVKYLDHWGCCEQWTHCWHHIGWVGLGTWPGTKCHWCQFLVGTEMSFHVSDTQHYTPYTTQYYTSSIIRHLTHHTTVTVTMSSIHASLPDPEKLLWTKLLSHFQTVGTRAQSVSSIVSSFAGTTQSPGRHRL